MTHNHPTPAGPALVAALTVATLLLTGCAVRDTSQPPAGTPTSVTPAGPPASQPPLTLPAGFPDTLPPPPDDTHIVSTEVVEQALLGSDLRQEHGTVIHHTIHYQHHTGTPAAVQRLLDHYRRTLPAAGWTITADQPPAPNRDPRRDQPGHRLRADGHGYTGATITIEQRDATTAVRVSLTSIDQTRKPSTHPPTTTMPGWYQALPAPPAGTRRYQIRISTRLGQPTTHLIEYENLHQPDPGHDRAAALAGHYLTALPVHGWAILHRQHWTEQPTTQGGIIAQRHHTIQFTGHQTTGTLHTTHTTTTAGQPLGTILTIHIPNQPFRDHRPDAEVPTAGADPLRCPARTPVRGASYDRRRGDHVDSRSGGTVAMPTAERCGQQRRRRPPPESPG
jgi:hypothetical protein